MFFLKTEVDLIYPTVRISSSNPSINNDWSAWKEGQNILTYSDVIFVGLNDVAFSEKEHGIYLISDSVKFPENIDSENLSLLMRDRTTVWKGVLSTGDDRVIDFGEDFGVNTFKLTQII